MESWWCWYTVGGILTAVVLIYLWWVGVFRRVRVVKAILKEKEFMYLQYKGDYDKQLGGEFEAILEDVKEDEVVNKAFLAGGGLGIGFYYDNPSMVADKEECRAVIGFTFKTEHDEDKDYIIKKFRKKEYKYGFFKDTMWLYGTFPIRIPKFIAFVLSPARFYSNAFRILKDDPELREKSKKSQVKNKCGVEMYDEHNIYYHLPVENFEEFDLTNIPAPEPKERKKK